MLQQEQQVGNAAGPALLDELSLKGQSLGVGNSSETTYLDNPAKGGLDVRPGWRRSSPTDS
jgi:hypothetical protein